MGRECEIERLIDAYGDGLLRMCRLYLKDATLAEDAVQKTFIKAYRARDAFRGDCSERTWLTGIAANVCRDMLRTPWMRRVDRRSEPELVASGAPANADDTVIREVERLSEKYRSAVILYYYRDLSVRETARALHISESAAAARLKRARDMLRARLEAWYFDEE